MNLKFLNVFLLVLIVLIDFLKSFIGGLKPMGAKVYKEVGGSKHEYLWFITRILVVQNTNICGL